MKKILLLAGLFAFEKSESQSVPPVAQKLFFISSAASGNPASSHRTGISNGIQFATGLEYAITKHNKVSAEVSFDTYSYQRTSNNYLLEGNANIISLALLYSRSFGTGRFRPFVRAGGGAIRISVPSIVQKTNFTTVTNAATVKLLTAGEAGAMFQLASRYAVFASAGYQHAGRSPLLFDEPFSVRSIKVGFVTPF